MLKNQTQTILRLTAMLALVVLCLAWLTSNGLLAAGGALGLCYVALRVADNRRQTSQKPSATPAPPPPPPRPRPVPLRKPVDPGDTDGLVGQMLAQGRFALLLRPTVVGNLGLPHLRQAQAALEESMALVPDGEVVLGRLDDALDDGRLSQAEIAAAQGRVVEVQRFFLDRFPVTNRQFYEFVAEGGYQQMALWDESIWPALLDFVDLTLTPGPRYWRDGCFRPREEDHPVVGVSWHEACAYARWVGKRLPTDAEWVKAGSWPVPLSATTRMQRKYPWGDTMDRSRANLWSPKSTGIVPVHQFAEGVSVGGVYQLIGNVWEWTGGNFRAADHVAGRLELPTPMKSIRGGAFDTYFENQATCQFQSGENPLGRRHNVGFRCAVGVCDLVLTNQAPPEEEQETIDHEPVAEQPEPTAEEVRA